MTFDEARMFRLTFGKYKGLTLDDVLAQSDGARYLDWLVDQDWLWENQREAIQTVLKNPVVSSRLDREINYNE